MANSDSRSSVNNDLSPNGQNIIFSSLVDNLHRYSPRTLAALLQNNPALDTSGLYLAPPFDPTQPPSVPFEYPTSHHGAEGDSLAYIIAHHFDFNFPIDTTSPTNPEPRVFGTSPNNNVPTPQNGPQNQVEELQHSLDGAIAFILARQIPFLRVLETAGCHNWKKLSGHLSAIAWKHLTVERLRPRSSDFWQRELTRLYCEYIQKGIVFEEVPIRLQINNKIVHAVTKLDNKEFTEGLATFLTADIPCQVISRLAVAGGNIVVERLQVPASGENLSWARDAVQWRGENEGFSVFHTYENIPGEFAKQRPLYFNSPYPDIFLRWGFLSHNTDDFFGVFKEVTGPNGLSYLEPFRRLDMSLVAFGCSVFLTSLEFAANRSRRRADNIWKNLMVLNMSHISEFFRKVIVDLADVSDEVAMDAREKLMQLTALDLTRI